MSTSNDVIALVARIRPILAGQPREIVGGALAELLSIWLAGHVAVGDRAATERMRKALLRLHLQTVRDLIPHNEPVISLRRGSCR